MRHPHNDQTILTLHCVGHVLWLNEQAIVCDATCLMKMIDAKSHLNAMLRVGAKW